MPLDPGGNGETRRCLAIPSASQCQTGERGSQILAPNQLNNRQRVRRQCSRFP